MPIQDIIGNEIVWLQNFPNDQNVENIEIGAGKSCFGKKYFPLCYLLDQTNNELPHFSGVADYHLNDCHYLDHIADFATLNVNGKQFSNIVFCNPYGIGFMGPEYAKVFLNKTASMLRYNGLIHIIGHTSNPWSNYRDASRRTLKLLNEGELINQFQLSGLTSLTADHTYIQDNYFTQTDINRQTVPNEMFTIQKMQ
jgi:hypothetical protein